MLTAVKLYLGTLIIRRTARGVPTIWGSQVTLKSAYISNCPVSKPHCTCRRGLSLVSYLYLPPDLSTRQHHKRGSGDHGGGRLMGDRGECLHLAAPKYNRTVSAFVCNVADR